MPDRIPDAEWLPDGSGKPGEGFVRRLMCRTCNGQPEPELKKEPDGDSPKFFFIPKKFLTKP